MAGRNQDAFDVIKSPPFKRRLCLAKKQWFFIPLLFLIPILALAGLLGDVSASSEVSASGVELSVKYSKRMRHGQSNEVEVNLFNGSTEVLQEVTIEINQDYLNKFANVQFNPSSAESANQVRILSLPAGARRQLRVNLRGKDHGKHEGEIKVSIQGNEVVRTKVDSLVFP